MNIAAIAAAGIFLESILTGKISEERTAVTALIIVCSMAVRFVCDRQGAKASFMAGSESENRTQREDLYKSSPFWRGLPVANCNIRDCSDIYGRCGAAGNIFRKICASAFLQPFGAGDIVYRPVTCQHESKRRAACLRTADSGIYCRCAEICQTACSINIGGYIQNLATVFWKVFRD